MDSHGTKKAPDDGKSSANSTLAPPYGHVEKALVESPESNEDVEVEGDEYPNSFRLFIITVALCLSAFCMALDNTILSTAIPPLYFLQHIKWVYLLSIFIFEIGSLICGVAPNSTALIIGRAIAGIGGAGICSGAILIISKTVPLHQRPSYTSAIGSMYGIASAAGPLMGGAFTDRLSWRWCFYINLPFGGVTAAFIIIFFKAPKRVRARAIGWREQLDQFDLLGGGSKYPWSNGSVIALFVIFGLSMAAFVAIQIWKKDNATVPPRIFKNRNVWGPAAFSAAVGASFFGIIYFLPVWFQAIKGVSAIKSGTMNLPLVSSIGAGLLTTFTVTTAHPACIGFQVLYGAGIGLGMQLTFTIVQAAIPVADIPIATALTMFSQTLGGALFVSVTQNIFSNLLTQNLMRVAPNVSPSLVVSTGATDLKKVIAKEFLPGVLDAYNYALKRTWLVSVATAAVSIIRVVAIDWRISVKNKPVGVVVA
ncbi:MFS general substrate transporter [Stipitochalara longipes BDJ]|nr:MFS general substrate transporter [Stipitochalara longipes BDJ]